MKWSLKLLVMQHLTLTSTPSETLFETPCNFMNCNTRHYLHVFCLLRSLRRKRVYSWLILISILSCILFKNLFLLLWINLRAYLALITLKSGEGFATSLYFVKKTNMIREANATVLWGTFSHNLPCIASNPTFKCMPLTLCNKTFFFECVSLGSLH